MKLLLKDFQITAVEEFVRHLRRASRDAEETGESWAVSLSSPTGSGKTVMAAAAIERLIRGDDEHPPDRDATFLWVTDQPELNEQTRRKMLWASSELGPSNLIVLDAGFDKKVFEAGNVYFLNTQKLGKDKSLVKVGDDRTHTVWETISRTAVQRPGSFYLFLDEAHRGMQEKPAARAEAASIVQKLIKGSPEDGLQPVPLIAGISATPERFIALVKGTNRTAKPISVAPEDVRASGLLKEAITLYHPTESQPSDLTMLRAAVRDWQEYVKRWKTYCYEENEPSVMPLLVVQVEDGTKSSLSKTDLGAAMKAIQDEGGPIHDDAFAHAFQSGTLEEFGGRGVRYLAPSDVQDDPTVQVMLFKTALNTGWDCPRAEVMMSFRTALDATHIAQLVGRMVRTPLARRIEADEHLNAVSLYLPHFDDAQLIAVVNHLTAPEDGIPTVEIRRGENTQTLNRAAETEHYFERLSRIPSYLVPRARKTSDVTRLMKLARQLERNGLLDDASESAIDFLIEILDDEYDRMKNADDFATLLDDSGNVDVRAVRYKLGETVVHDVLTTRFAAAFENVNDLFNAAGRKLREGLHKAWWRQRSQNDPSVATRAKLELCVLAGSEEVLTALNREAGVRLGSWFKTLNEEIKKLPEGDQQVYREIKGLASEPQMMTLSLPKCIEVTADGRAWSRHLYVDESHSFRVTLGGWESKVVEKELEREGILGWLRNIDRKDWALRIPYLDKFGQYRSQFPDFLFLRRDGENLTVDLLDPHNPDLDDAPEKAVGLAKFAAEHSHDFGRIELISVKEGDIRRLNLCEEDVRNRVAGIRTREELKLLYDS